MGYELDKLMRQFGVSSPSLTYGGAQPGTANFQQDKAAFDQYANKYVDQMGNNAMYDQQQFWRPSRNIPMLAQPTYAGGAAPVTTTPPPTLTQTVTQPQHDIGTMPDISLRDQRLPGSWNDAAFPYQQNEVVGAESGSPELPISDDFDGYGGDYGGSFDGYGEAFFDGYGMRRPGDNDQISAYARGGLAKLAARYADGGEVVVNPFFGDEDVPAQLPPAMAQQSAPQRMDLQAMLEKYMAPTSTYGEDLKTARAAASKETEAFNAMLQRAMENQADTAPSKAEMYFRLAAAFGAPTRSGNFGESLGKVGEAMGQYSKETREAARNKAATQLQLGLEGQKARMQGAKDDLTTLRTLTGDEMKDKRAMVAELLKERAKLTDPQSPAGKQALDEGKKPGTPEYQARVSEIAKENANKLDAQIAALTAAASAASGNLALNQKKVEAAAQNAKKLTPAEVKLKEDTENDVAALDSTISAIGKAYKLNPNTFDNSLPDLAQRKLLEASGSTHPKLLATQELDNVLTGKALSGLREAFGGNPTEGERKILMDVQGIGAKSREARDKILQNAFVAAKAARERKAKRLESINAGAYRETTQPPGDE